MDKPSPVSTLEGSNVRPIRSLVETFSPLRIRDFRVYLSGQAISLIGTWLQVTAQGWVVWTITGSEAQLGIVGMLATLPLLLFARWAGPLADRLDRRRTLIITAISSMVLAFILATLVQTNLIQLWHVYVLSFLLGTITAIDLPAQQAFLGDLSGMGEIRKAINLNTMIVQVSRLIGPAFAGFIIAGLGAATAFYLNGLSFLAVIASLLVLRSRQERVSRHQDSSSGSFSEGVRFLRSQPRLQDLLFFVVLITFLIFPVITILPAFSVKILHGDAQTLGFLLASSGAGSLVGTLIVVPVALSSRRPGPIVLAAVFWMGVWAIVFATSTSLFLSILSLFLTSMGAPAVLTVSNGLLQTLAPPEMRARMVSVLLMVGFGMQPIANVLVGYGAEVLGTSVAVVLNGVLLVLGGLVMLGLRRQLWNWDVMQAIRKNSGS